MQSYYFDHLFTGRQWLQAARLDVDGRGDVAGLTPDASSEGSERLPGFAVPGVPNLHSHAHQRAMAGLAERSGEGEDGFWTWREVMYRHLAAITPEQLEAVAAQLYLEMLQAGYTAVAEFQYLHHDPRGRPYAQPAEMTLRTLAAARRVGLGITCLPVLYAHGGFGGRPAGEGQRRFLHSGAEAFLDLCGEVRAAVSGDPDSAAGFAPHSLRAVSEELLREALAGSAGSLPVHLHVAEQSREVEECLEWSGRRPVEWLLERFEVNGRWCLIHATHMTEGETRDLAASGAVAGLCPTTEANLGDGIFDGVRFQGAGGRLGIGSDSHIGVDPAEELRWLEYGQRLRHGGRNLLAGGPGRSTGRQLLEAVLAGGAQACGRRIGRLEPGYRADLVVLDAGHPLLAGRRGDEVLDSWIFAGHRGLVRDVVVGGRRVIRDGRHAEQEAVEESFRRAVETLRGQG